MFKGPNGFGRMMNILMCVVMCVVLSVVIPLAVEARLEITGVLTPVGFIQGFVLSYFVSYLWGDLLPAVVWGGKLAGVLKAHGIIAHVIKCVVVALVYITVISFSMAFVNNIVEGGMAGTVGFWIMIYPAALASGFVAIVLLLPVCQKIAMAVSGFDPTAAMREPGPVAA